MTAWVDSDENKSFDYGLPYFFTQGTHVTEPDNKMLALVGPDSESQRSKVALENILRWEDDGGQMLDACNPKDRSNPAIARQRPGKYEPQNPVRLEHSQAAG